jgi:hypothetical protein
MGARLHDIAGRPNDGLRTRRGKMGRRTWWHTITIGAFSVTLASVAGLRAQISKAPERLTADDVIATWKPYIKAPKDYQQLGASPKQSPGVAAYSFRVEGPSFEDLWNHYADLCGISEQYEAKTFLTSANAGVKGSYVVTDRASSDDRGQRGLSVFLLKNDRYTVTVTIQPDPDGKAVRGSISAVVP